MTDTMIAWTGGFITEQHGNAAMAPPGENAPTATYLRSRCDVHDWIGATGRFAEHAFGWAGRHQVFTWAAIAYLAVLLIVVVVPDRRSHLPLRTWWTMQPIALIVLLLWLATRHLCGSD